MKQQAHGREKLLHAAVKLLLEGGPGAVTVQGMARIAGVSAPALYKHFRSRDEVIGLLQQEGWSEFRAALATCLSKKTPLARLRACGQRTVEFGLDRPQLYRLLFLSEEASRPPAPGEPELRAASTRRDRKIATGPRPESRRRAEAGRPLAQHARGRARLKDQARNASLHVIDAPRPGLAFLVERVKACQSSGDLPRRASAEDLALAFWATCHGLVTLYLLGGGAPRFDRERYLSMARRALVSMTRGH